MSVSVLQAHAAAPAPPAVSRFEFVPGWFAYWPVIVQWLALGLRYGDLSLPTAANPGVTTGGLCGERKSELLGLAGNTAREWIAPYDIMQTGQDDLPRAEDLMARAGLTFPVVVKPDIGCNGTGVRLVANRARLAETLRDFPRDVRLVLQEFVPLPGEAGIFYIRHPDEPTGRVTSLTLKYPPTVMGDGISTLRQLIAAHPRHGRLAHLYYPRLAARLNEVPAAVSEVQLVFAGNHCKGSIFADGAADITTALTAQIDRIARDIPDFHFGRFDVRYASLATLRRGEDFTIIEINGVGAEATHIWDPATPLRRIWGDQLAHYGAAWRIAAAMRARGARTSGLLAMARDWRTQLRLMASYPLND